MTENVDVVGKAKELLSGVLEQMGIEAEVTATEEEDRILLDISSEETDRIIGRRGQTIDALLHIVGKMLSRFREERGKPVSVYTDGYRGRHIEKLEALAQRMGEKALSSVDRVPMSPMNAFDRRIVHMFLKEVEGVSTESEGEGKDRHVVVIPGASA